MNKVKVGTLLRWVNGGLKDDAPDDLGIVVGIPEPVCSECPHKHRSECNDLDDCGREHECDFSDEDFSVEWMNETAIMRHSPQQVEAFISSGQVEVIP